MKHNETLPERMAAWLRNDRVAIFLFHGVILRQAHPVRNYTGKHIEAHLFTKCMKHMVSCGQPLSMSDVLAHCESGEPFPPRAFAVTFDDGFENNLSVAAPILDDLQIPAMIYVTTGFVEENEMSWIDRIEYAVEEASAQTLQTEWSNEAFALSGTKSRVEFLNAVRRYVKNDPNCNPIDFADDLCARLGKPGRLPADDPLDLKMSWDQVRAASTSEFLSIGGHGHTHSILSFLKPQELAFELDTSLFLLSKKAGVAPAHYSYPEGLAHCYSQDVIDELRKRSVRCCPTAMDGTNEPGADPFHLARIMVA